MSVIDIAESFENILGVERKSAIEMAKLPNGYAYAYQVLWYILFANHKKELDESVIREFDKYLCDYVYEKIYYDLPVS